MQNWLSNQSPHMLLCTYSRLLGYLDLQIVPKDAPSGCKLIAFALQSSLCHQALVKYLLCFASTAPCIQLLLQSSKHMRRDLEDQPGVNYDKVQNWFSELRMQGAGVPEGKCLVDFDLIAFAVNISNTHWIPVLVYLRQRIVYVLDSIDTAEVCMSPTLAC